MTAQPLLVRCSPPRCDAGPESAVAAEDEESQKYFKTLKSAFLDLARQKGGSST